MDFQGVHYYFIMRDAWEWDDAEEEGWDRLYQEIAPQAIGEFTSGRLRSYYLANLDLAYPAFRALEFARSLEPAFPLAALVFAATAIEVTIKDALLRPVVFGLVHNHALANFIAKLSTNHTRGIEPFADLLSGIFQQFAGIDLKTFKRDGSSVLLLSELGTLHAARNQTVHTAETKHAGLAPLAIDVASTLLNVFFPALLKKLGLHLHDPVTICAEIHITLPFEVV